MKKKLPNFLTILRGVLALAIIILFFLPLAQKFTVIFILFIIASLSDYFDGLLARKFKTVSSFGVVFDPLFDKILVLSLIVLIYPLGVINEVILILLLLRDITTDVFKNYLLAHGVKTPAIYSAKLKTASQMAMLALALFYLAWPYVEYISFLANAFGVLAVIFSLYSGAIYAKRFTKFLKSEHKSSSK